MNLEKLINTKTRFSGKRLHTRAWNCTEGMHLLPEWVL